jgi:multidrug transporter EmrE-like cation transporter
MFTEKTNIIGYSILLSILGVLITGSRKYYLTKIGVHSVTIIDTILTGVIISIMIISHASPGQIMGGIKKMSLRDWSICAMTSFGIAVSVLLGRNLLIHNDIAYLDILDGGVDVIITAIIAYFFYKEEMSWRKIGGIALVLMGMSLLH